MKNSPHKWQEGEVFLSKEISNWKIESQAIACYQSQDWS